MTPFERIEIAFLRRDTNNGKSYCIECDGNERKGKVKHKPDCVLVEVNAVLAEVERETIARVVAWLRREAKNPARYALIDAESFLFAAERLESEEWKEDGDG